MDVSDGWKYGVRLLRNAALLGAVCGFGDLLFYGSDYKTDSPDSYVQYVLATCMLLVLAAYPRGIMRQWRFFAVPLLLIGLVDAYYWAQLSGSASFARDPGTALVLKLVAVIAIGFVVESIVVILGHPSISGRARS